MASIHKETEEESSMFGNNIGACVLAAKAAASINPDARSATPLNYGLLAEAILG